MVKARITVAALAVLLIAVVAVGDDRDVGSFPVKVERESYPAPEYKFPKAKVGMDYRDSKPDFPPPTQAPEDAPNVLLVLLDDVGFGCASTFGGLVRMPTADRLAKEGLRYNNFHTTALCSPTRATLLTGRNHHSCATGIIQELAIGYPGYSGVMPKSCGTVAQILQHNGYATGFWGKNHNVPDNHTSAAGPFTHWPTSQGFDYFYGFIGGDTDQFYPALVRGTTPVQPPKTPEEGYHLTTDLADDCISWMRQQKSIAPDRPLFAYFSTGAAHAPHQPPRSWRGKNKGRFDAGWDKYREVVYQRQLEMGIIPKGTELTPRPKEIPGWDEQSDDAKRLLARQMENFADFLEHTDFEVGRLVDALQEMGELDNTLVIYVIGDNGCSAEGTLTGIINEFMSLNGVQPDIQTMLPRIDEIGKPGTSPHFAVPWAWAGSTPFKWTKQVASHFGGTANAAIMSWPKRIERKGELRSQFHHSIDIVPTILETIGIKEPVSLDGVHQKPIEGTSMAYTFDDASAETTRSRQYFEMFGNRGIYVDGWYACARHGRLPWKNADSAPFDIDRWELYNLEEDFSQANDLAAKHPKKLRELQDAFVAEATKYNVFPLDDRFSERLDVTLRPSFFYGRDSVTFYPGMVRLPEGSAPKTTSTNHTVTVNATIPESGAEGVLICIGGDSSGWSLCVENGKLVYHYNWFDTERYKVESAGPLPVGDAEIRMEFVNEGEKPGGPASVSLFVNGEKVGSGRLPKQVAYRFSVETMDVGMDTLSPVSKTYVDKLPFAFSGEIESVRLDLK